MNFSELKTEFAARGFDNLSDTRQGQYINWARAELDEMELWPYREASATGASPLSISDLGVVETVTDLVTNTRLDPMDYASLLEQYGDLSTSGTPVAWYRATPSGTPEIATYPVATNIGVQYWKVCADLTGTDTPSAPTRFHGLIVDIAARKASLEAGEFQGAQMLQVEIDRGLWVMRNALLWDSGQSWVSPLGDDS